MLDNTLNNKNIFVLWERNPKGVTSLRASTIFKNPVSGNTLSGFFYGMCLKALYRYGNRI